MLFLSCTPPFSDDVAVIPVFDRRVHIDPDSPLDEGYL
jgi:hypothetical protein